MKRAALIVAATFVLAPAGALAQQPAPPPSTQAAEDPFVWSCYLPEYWILPNSLAPGSALVLPKSTEAQEAEALLVEQHLYGVACELRLRLQKDKLE